MEGDSLASALICHSKLFGVNTNSPQLVSFQLYDGAKVIRIQ